ncbi:hypothetical protein D6B99_03810 [Arachidicoccus soli]|uniref:Uncharacterized protein n=1 Tax=Arachidicoccus soli TaxID=2341117 RepID=A0A386HN99_9BACT|nr:hypothetical protein D6B99_03810 [Arachidicoccus soli]
MVFKILKFYLQARISNGTNGTLGFPFWGNGFKLMLPIVIKAIKTKTNELVSLNITITFIPSKKTGTSNCGPIN